jgi:hypothetical protein
MDRQGTAEKVFRFPPLPVDRRRSPATPLGPLGGRPLSGPRVRSCGAAQVNCRMGGGPVRDTNLLVWGVDLVEEHLMACAGEGAARRCHMVGAGWEGRKAATGLLAARHAARRVGWQAACALRCAEEQREVGWR